MSSFFSEDPFREQDTVFLYEYTAGIRSDTELASYVQTQENLRHSLPLTQQDFQAVRNGSSDAWTEMRVQHYYNQARDYYDTRRETMDEFREKVDRLSQEGVASQEHLEAARHERAEVYRTSFNEQVREDARETRGFSDDDTKQYLDEKYGPNQRDDDIPPEQQHQQTQEYDTERHQQEQQRERQQTQENAARASRTSMMR